MDIKDWFQIGAWAVAIIGGLVAAFKAIAEMRKTNVQRAEDLRWKRAEMAKKCLDEAFADPLARAALKMLDWNGLTYKLPDREISAPITHDVRRTALRSSGTVFSPGGDEPLIRDAFDALFEYMQTFEHLIEIQLIDFADVDLCFSYYVAKLARPGEYAVISTFLQTYEYAGASKFLARFPAWQSALEYDAAAKPSR